MIFIHIIIVKLTFDCVPPVHQLIFFLQTKTLVSDGTTDGEDDF